MTTVLVGSQVQDFAKMQVYYKMKLSLALPGGRWSGPNPFGLARATLSKAGKPTSRNRRATFDAYEALLREEGLIRG